MRLRILYGNESVHSANMTRVDFYILPEQAPTPGDPLAVACRLCDKAAAARQTIYVYAPDATAADTLDSMLWSFRQGGFITHERWTDSARLDPPLPAVLIGADPPPDSHQQVMINLGHEIPPFFSRFERVLEMVHGDIEAREHGRARYRFYRDRGYALETHELTAGTGLR